MFLQVHHNAEHPSLFYVKFCTDLWRIYNLAVDVTVVSQYILIFFSVTAKYCVDEPIIYKLSEFKKTQVMKNKHALLKIKIFIIIIFIAYKTLLDVYRVYYVTFTDNDLYSMSRKRMENRS